MTDQALSARQQAIADSGWGYHFRLLQPTNPAFWLYIVVLPIGVFQFFQMIDPALRVFMPAILSAALIWTVFALPWIWFISHKDRFGRTTGKVAAVGFAWGAMVGTWVMALPGNAAITSILAKVWGSDLALNWSASISAPVVEESAKGVGIVMLVLLARPFLRTAYDGLILGAFVGLGFQVAEDFLYGLNAASASFGIDQVHNEFQTFITRGLLAGFVSHALYSALVGAGIGWWVEHRNDSVGVRMSRTLPLFFSAWLAHFAWDAVGVFGPVVLALTAIYALVLVTIIVRWTDRRERPWMADLMAPELEAGLITEDELTALVGSTKTRRHFVHGVKKAHGKAAGKAARHVLDAELDLADALTSAQGEVDKDVEHAESELVRIRGVYDAALVG